MKKNLLYVVMVLLLTIVTVSGTYAFFTATASSGDDKLATDSHNFEVIYSGADPFNEPLTLVTKKEEGMNRTIKIRMAEDSVLAQANVYIKIEEIDPELAKDALVWEVYKTYKGETKEYAKGTFGKYCGLGAEKKQCESGDNLYLVENYALSTEDTSFTIYIWLNGSAAGNEVIGKSFSGYIGAETENFTGNLQ